MAQPAITNFWTTYSGIIGSKINKKMGYTSKLLALFSQNKEEWKQEAGFVQKHIQYDRAGITADSEAEYTYGDNAAYPEPVKSNNTTNYGGDSTGGALNARNNCDPPADVIGFNPSERGFGLLQKAFQTNDFSLEDLRAAAESAQATGQIEKILLDLGKEYWLRMYRDEFARISGNRFIALENGTFTENGDEFECFEASTAARWNSYGFESTSYDVSANLINQPDKQDTKQLSWAHLEAIQLRIIEEDATGEYATAMANGMPVCVLVTDPVTALRLLKTSQASGNTDSAVRVDIRESSQSDKLLQGMGVTHSINGWVILSENAPDRYDITGDSGDSSGAAGTGVWTKREFYTGSATSRSINSAYRSAAFVESYVMLPKAFTCFVPKPSFTGVGDVKLSVQDWSGDYEFINQREKDRNPWGNHGWFQGKIASANVAKDKEVLYTIRHAKGSFEGV